MDNMDLFFERISTLLTILFVEHYLLDLQRN